MPKSLHHNKSVYILQLVNTQKIKFVIVIKHSTKYTLCMKFNDNQLEAINHNKGPMLVLAGPGSGKTKVLVERVRKLIEEYLVDPRNILVITFSKKAALEMQERFINHVSGENYPVTFGTFHAVFFYIIKQYYDYDENSLITEYEKKKYIKRLIKEDSTSEALEQIIGEISRIKNSISSENNISDYTPQNILHDLDIKKIYKEYQSLLKKNNKLDFDDMIDKCHEILTLSETERNRWQNKFKYILVDEFQDSNEKQFAIIKLLAGNEKNVWCCGDDDQSIYKFRGAYPKVMTVFFNEFEDCKQVLLKENYRCSSKIIDTANNLIRYNTSRLAKEKQLASGPNKNIGDVNCFIFDNADDEADYVLRKIQELIGKNKSESVAILYRTEGSARLIEEKMIMNDINYYRKSKNVSFYEEESIKDIITYLRLALSIPSNNTVVLSEYNKELLFRILNKPDRQLSRECMDYDVLTLNKIINYFNQNPVEKNEIEILVRGLRIIQGMNCFAAINFILKGLGYEQYYHIVSKHPQEKKALIDELIGQARKYQSIKKFLNYIDEYDIKNKENNSKDVASEIHNTIVMQTIHTSKGLEYDTVIIVGLEEGILPHKKAITLEDIEEERRLLYVAITRAKKNLIICGRDNKRNGRMISGFIKELGI